MIRIREAGTEDGPALVRLFQETPMRAGTAFVLDRGPDFNALLRLRGRFRTFIASRGSQVIGAVTAIWHEGRDGDRMLVVGEIADLRVAPGARGGPVAARLLATAREAFAATRTDWVLCLIGERNRDAQRLVVGKAGFPPLRLVARYASAHFPAYHLPLATPRNGVQVRPAESTDASLLADLVAELSPRRSFRPTLPFPWPDPTAQHRGWIASGPDGQPRGALMVWEGMAVRRIRVVRYGAADQLLRGVMAVAALVGVSPALPAPGDALQLWASRWFGVLDADVHTARALMRHALRAAAIAGQHILQLNIAQDDPLFSTLPHVPHTLYWTAVYACPFGEAVGTTLQDGQRMGFADLALV